MLRGGAGQLAAAAWWKHSLTTRLRREYDTKQAELDQEKRKVRALEKELAKWRPAQVEKPIFFPDKRNRGRPTKRKRGVQVKQEPVEPTKYQRLGPQASPNSSAQNVLAGTNLTPRTRFKLKRRILPYMVVKDSLNKAPKPARRGLFEKKAEDNTKVPYGVKSAIADELGLNRNTIFTSKEARQARRNEMNRKRGLCVAWMLKSFNAHEMPGVKDATKIRKGSKRRKKLQEQTYILADTLINIHEGYIEQCESPDDKVSLPTFCRARPAYIKLNHVMKRQSCLCKPHANMSYMCQAISGLPKSTHTLADMADADINAILDKYKYTYVKYYTWDKPKEGEEEGNPGHRLRQRVVKFEDFRKQLFKDLIPFRAHVHRVRVQSDQGQLLKDKHPLHQLILQVDYAMNYGAYYQKEIQKLFYDRPQVSLHCMVGKVHDFADIQLPEPLPENYSRKPRTRPSFAEQDYIDKQEEKKKEEPPKPKPVKVTIKDKKSGKVQKEFTVHVTPKAGEDPVQPTDRSSSATNNNGTYTFEVPPQATPAQEPADEGVSRPDNANGANGAQRPTRIYNYNFIGVTDDLTHNFESIYIWIEEVLARLLHLHPDITHVHFISDGPSSQYRNRYICKMICDFPRRFKGLTASWMWLEKGHGKGPCDGLGGVAKRLANEETKKDGFIQSAEEFCSKVDSDKITLIYLTEEEMTQRRGKVEKIKCHVEDVPGIMKAHQAIVKHGYLHIRDLSCFCDNCFDRDGRFITNENTCPGWKKITQMEASHSDDEDEPAKDQLPSTIAEKYHLQGRPFDDEILPPSSDEEEERTEEPQVPPQPQPEASTSRPKVGGKGFFKAEARARVLRKATQRAKKKAKILASHPKL